MEVTSCGVKFQERDIEVEVVSHVELALIRSSINCLPSIRLKAFLAALDVFPFVGSFHDDLFLGVSLSSDWDFWTSLFLFFFFICTSSLLAFAVKMKNE